MNKKILENINEALPDIIKDFSEAIKDNFDNHAQEVLSDSTGIVSSGIKLLGKPFIDKYFEKLKDKKLENYGLAVYIQAGLTQAIESLEEIKSELKYGFDASSIKISLKNTTVNFNKDDILLVFRPTDHPAITLVKECYEQSLRDCDISSQAIKQFTKHFNQHIKDKIRETFGNDYNAHIEEIKNFTLNDNETDFLLDMIKLGRIGFKETERLKYEQTYAYWKKVSAFKEGDTEKSKESEPQLQPIENLITDYFSQEEDSLDKMFFVLADFGKGKSVFLRHYAATLAKDYLETHNGLFPVYFNLRDFKNYSSEHKLGVIADYLETIYALKIDDEYFKHRQYIFLVDSLDESGELNKANIDKVIYSVKKIQQLDKTLQRANRIIITSRPFDEGLQIQLYSHKPYVIRNSEGREIEHFASVYGFKKEQFNEWLTDTLRYYRNQNDIQATGFAKEVIVAIKEGQQVDIHDTLLNNKTLSASELRRPIFAYMIFQLIINNIDFSAIGKIGVYLSFLNLLTKEAKHINDISCKIDLKQEFEFRNLLHVIASLWMYERQQGKQGILKKSDICRVLDGENKRESDLQILDRYKNMGVTEIQFLSHSYFGEDDNVLHFQHQSFAEILLAEYYLKVFIKYALDEQTNIEEARTKLMLGDPTDQTIQFFQEMLRLLKDTVCENNCDAAVIEKRKLLFPLMASLCTQKNNKLFCNNIYYQWFNQYPIIENQAAYPLKALENWCIDQDKLSRIIALAKAVIESKTNYILTKAETKTVLYDNELLVIQNKKLSDFAPDMDRWLALLVGNTLYNDIEKEQFFNGKIKSFQHLFDLIRNWNHAYRTSAPIWGRELFMGIDMRDNNDYIDLHCTDFSGINFSYSYLNKIRAGHSNFSGVKFYGNSFLNVDIGHSDLIEFSITNILFIDFLDISFSTLIQTITVPLQLSEKLRHDDGRYVNYGNNKTFIGSDAVELTNFFTQVVKQFCNAINGFLIYGLKKDMFSIEEIKSWFEFETEELECKFYAEFDKLKEYEIGAEIAYNDASNVENEMIARNSL